MAAPPPPPAPLDSPDLAWPRITRDSKPWTRWWWMGSAVDEPNLKRELEQIAGHGFGGVEITPLYGAVGYESKYIDFLSPQWMKMLQFTVVSARDLDLGVDMATGTGWPFGGPSITPENADAQLVHDEQKLSEKPTRMKVKRAAPGDEGLVVNPYSAAAMQSYLKPFDDAFKNFPRTLINGQFHDSFEYTGNWSHELPAKFKQMHGYDLADHVAELWGTGDLDTVGRVRSDYRETLGQMHLEYLKVWVDWSHAHGFATRNQAHGAPGNLLDLYAVADIPETETFGSMPFDIPGFRDAPEDAGDPRHIPTSLATKFASSAAHVTGKNLASSETFTWMREHFKASLSQMKPQADTLFLAGINHLFYHGTCYSPADAVWPGWNFYASVEFNPENTIWRDLPAMNQYYARCQSILQSGQSDNDILLYWPIYDLLDQPSRTPEIRVTIEPKFMEDSSLWKAAKWLSEHGYSYDYISDAQLISRAKLDPYKVIVVPHCRNMPLATLEKLAEFAESGAKLLFEDTLPIDVPGLSDLKNHRAQMKVIAKRLQGRAPVRIIDELLWHTDVQREAMVDWGLQFVRRKYEQGCHYFIANLTNHEIKGWMPLSVSCASAGILDPLNGNSGVAATKSDIGKTQIYIDLVPGESLIVRTFASKQIEGTPWIWHETGGDAVAITGKWQIDFIEGGPKLPASISTDRLASWTTLGDDEAKRFAGTARYSIDFDAPTVSADDWLLDLGDVRESARVTINGQSVATLWSVPFQIPVGKFLKPGRNKLEIEVTNLAANRIRDLDRQGVAWKKFHEINFVNINYKPFDASNWPLTDSGLLGAVRLVPVKNMELGNR